MLGRQPIGACASSSSCHKHPDHEPANARDLPRKSPPPCRWRSFLSFGLAAAAAVLPRSASSRKWTSTPLVRPSHFLTTTTTAFLLRPVHKWIPPTLWVKSPQNILLMLQVVPSQYVCSALATSPTHPLSDESERMAPIPVRVPPRNPSHGSPSTSSLALPCV